MATIQEGSRPGGKKVLALGLSAIAEKGDQQRRKLFGPERAGGLQVA